MSQPVTPAPDAQTTLQPVAPSWRERVSTNFHKRRQTPAQQAANAQQLKDNTKAKWKIQIPSTMEKMIEKDRERKQQTGELQQQQPFSRSTKFATEEKEAHSNSHPSTISSPSSSSSSSSSTSSHSHLSSAAHALGPAPPSSSLTYTLPPPSPTSLYRLTQVELELLPLELFDHPESYGDLTGPEWLSLRASKYHGGGIPAKSCFYASKEYAWTPCIVLDYDQQLQEYTIQFSNPTLLKKVKRLSILFDDEDPERFYARLEHCRAGREEALAQRRYNQFLAAQAQSLFAPLQQSALHGIVGKLMMDNESLVLARQRSVEGLLIEVREEYGLAMKHAIVEFKRRIPEEEKKLEHLHLPPLPPSKSAPYLAVIDLSVRDLPLPKAISLISSLHFTHHPEATQVVLALFRAWESVKSARFLDESIEDAVSLFEYQDAQEAHFASMRERVQNEWRSLVINLIRDNLNNVYKLFVNDLVEYNNSELKRFLKMVGCMLRQQLCTLAEESMKSYVENLKRYQDPLKAIREKALKKHGNQYQLTDADILEGYLQGSSLSSLNVDSGDSSGVRPLFVFKMSTSGHDVIFLPGLDSIELTVMNLLNIPTKLQSICQIDNDVVPLLGMGDIPLASQHTCPQLYASCERYKDVLRAIINDNLKQPLALAALYQEYSELLQIDTEKYVYRWFHPYEAEMEELAAKKSNKSKDEEEALKQKEQQLLEAESMEDEDEEGGKKKSSSIWGVPGEDSEALAAEEKKRQEEERLKRIEEERRKRGHSLQETEREIQKYIDAVQDIQQKSPSEVTFRMIKIELTLLKEQLIHKAKEVSNKLLEGLATEVQQQNVTITQQFEQMLARIKMKSSNVNELAELKNFSKQVEVVEIPRLQQEIAAMQAKMRVLMHFRYPISRSDFNLSWNVNRYPLHLAEGLEDAKLQIELDNQVFQKQLQDEQQTFQNDLDAYAAEVQSFAEFGLGTTAQMEQYASKVEALQEKLDKADALIKSFNERDQLFGDVPMVYDELAEIKKKFKPYFELWSTTSLFLGSYSVWMTGPFVELDPVLIGKDVTTWHKLMYKLERELLAEDALKPSKVAAEMKQKIQEFKSNLPVITWLRNPGLRPRHWEKLSSLLAPGRQAYLTPDNDLTLAQILALDINTHRAAIEDICSSASKEYALEQQLDKMLKEWKTVNFELEEYKQTKTYILKGFDEILTLLDDQIMQTQALRGSPFIRFFENRTKKWESRLQMISQIMEEWLACQKTWLYLHPIFASEDIMRQMPIESRRFGVVDAYWRKTMDAAKKTGNILDFVSETDNLLKTFQESNKMLELIGKHLNEYLETKRLAFPRFYFLSNDELLSILSQTKRPEAVQPHLSKCFDAMHQVHFLPQAERQLIIGMYSAENEYVRFEETIDPDEGIRKGNVEVWLKDVERVMRDTLRTLSTRYMLLYEKMPREQWVLLHTLPGQVCLSVSQMFWTKQVTEALSKKHGLVAYTMQLNKQLERLVELVRGDLTPLQRLTLGALTVIDVHARDVVSKMIEEGVKSDKDFEWLSQMRYYWEADSRIDLKPSGSHTRPLNLDGSFASDEPVPPGLLRVRMINTQMDYAYEYLGNSTRLVITPLTDRCYRTLMGAVHLHLGGAPEGPAGTGKTETVKDLSKAVAIQCVVFNCSDALNFRSMAKFFKGLAASGAWSCFDEFNRIELEVLSVIAQQISSIQRAIIENKHTFFFDNVNIPLIHTCSVFITMNPGYAGRAELPDNLKALFRTVAMMIPDYALIAEIVLYSYGYSEARALARKIVGCLRLSSEQLSSQDHYDFGMRAVKSILSAAGKLKSDMPSENEDWLIVRAISDCNVPKFVAADIPLFLGICKDLFPTVDMKANERANLLESIKNVIAEKKLQATPSFITKCIELYDTILVRHGLMLVGQTFSGKSTSLKVLQQAITNLSGQGNMNEVNVYYMNPKSVQLDQLYGADNPSTNEWVDGIIPVVMRECVADTRSGKWKWVVFDGPVDALWIENMNTVLDDNKKLCLASGEQIKLAQFMSMIFEVEDLSQASPATVSRCGMVYGEPRNLGWKVLVDSWLLQLDPLLAPYIDDIRHQFYWLIAPSLEFLNRRCKYMLPTSDMTLVSSCLKLMESLLDELLSIIRKQKERDESRKNDDESLNVAKPPVVDAEGNPVAQVSSAVIADDSWMDSPEFRPHWIESMFLFSLIWSVGAAVDTEGHQAFSHFLRDITQGKVSEDILEYDRVNYLNKRSRVPFPTPDSKGDELKDVYEFVYQRKTNQWVSWMALDAPYKIPDGAKFHEIIVPTVETIRINWILDLLITHHKHVLLTGPTGTGKTIGVQTKLLRGLDRSVYLPMMLAFSARTSSNQTQDIIDGKLERRRQGVLGPPPGKRCVIFVDDLNMPSKEKYGAQPPIELLRQWMDYGGWYDRKLNTFRHIVDVQFVAAMGPPGGGRNPVSHRYIRHYNNLCLIPYEENSLKRIFTTIMKWWLEPFPAKVRSTQRPIVDATIATFFTVCKELLPTPAKSHYTFNLRDVSKVFQGIMSVETDVLKEPIDVVRLWSHENTRVFCDRLIDQQDISWFESLIDQQIISQFKMEINDVFPGQQRRQIYADFSNPRSNRKSYMEVTDHEALAQVVEAYLLDYNTVEKTQMHLVLFTSAIDHIARISRIIRQPYGNALLVGVGGSGRQSLTRLASFIADFDIFQVEITKTYSVADWKEDLRDVLRKAGIHNKPIVFLFTDSQVKNESFIEDLSAILNNGEVPNLFPPEDYLPIIEQVLPDARKAGKAESNASVFSYFVERCKTNMHVVICLSPIGQAFRNRLRMFPSLISCSSIDWFHPWPTDALKQVATRFLKEVNLEDDIKAGVVEVCVDMQERVNQLSREYLASLRRYNYVTPTSYLELIKIFRQLFETTRTNIKSQENRYRTGLEKLKETEIQVKAMQVQLEALRPQLIQSSKETQELIKTIEQRSLQVAQTRKIVSEEEKICNQQAEIATKIKQECEEQLAEAMPALNNAMKALRVLKKSALDELRTMKVPTQGVVMTCEALCIMMGVQPRKVGAAGTAKTLDYWQPAKNKLLNDAHLFVKLQTYDKDNIPQEVIDKVRPYCKNPDFAPAKIANASKAAEGFCRWVLAMEVYDRVAKQVQPKREALGLAQKSLQAASEELAAKKQQLQEVQDLLDDLNAQFELVNQKKVMLEQQVKECSERLDRAEKLLGGLANEKGRWQERAVQLSSDFVNVVGNILVSSGVIAYLGVFTSLYRDTCVRKWVELLQSKNIPCDQQFSLSKVLGDPVQIRQWAIQHLPVDDFSTENAIILTKSLRWSLIIDPQQQANRWIKHMEDEKTSLKVVRQTDDQFVRVLSTAVQVGLPVLIEAVGETLDPVLEPLLLKQTFKSGARLLIRLGSDTLSYSEDFRLYMTTKLHNPHYPPEVSTRVTLINFMITLEGLQDQALNIVVSQEEPELEAERGELILKNAENQRQLQLIEDKILEKLNESQGNILDDEDLVNTLQKSKQAAKLIEKRVAAAAKMEENINKTRMSYQSVAFSAANLFFCISDLSGVDPMYQYSLQWFIQLFLRAIKDADKSLDVHVRTANIDKQFLRSLYVNICRSLFEKDKLLFSFMLCLRILQGKNQLNNAELRFLLTGLGASTGVNRVYPENPTIIEPNAPPFVPNEEEEEEEEEEEDENEEKAARERLTAAAAARRSKPGASLIDTTSERWLADVYWQQIVNLSELPAFAGLDEHFQLYNRKWRNYYESADPFARQLPGAWDSKLSLFQKLLVLRCLRQDKMTIAIQSVVSHFLGKEFITPPPFDLQTAFSDSDPCTPLIFVLSPGVDPVKDVYKLAHEMGFSTPDRLFSISLGQGQGPLAETAIREAVDKGTWVLLQNCHLAVSWLPTLQKILDEINPATVDNNFRLWLTSMPSPHFPVSILQNGVKITNEPPKGIKANLAQSYRSIDQAYFDDCKKPEEFKKLMFGLSMFHAIVQERRKYGSIGWNVMYEFTESDLSISRRQLKLFLSLYDDVPFKALKYLIGQLNYGGRVTDDWDRRTITYILEDFFNEKILEDDYMFDTTAQYHCLRDNADMHDYRQFINDLPTNDDSEAFGLHENANTTTAIKESSSMFETLLQLQPRSSASGATSREVVISQLARDIESQLPPNFDMENARRKYPVSYMESMNTVLVQELVRFNKLLDVVKRSLTDLQKAVKGEVVMSLELEQMGDAMFNGYVPSLWSAVAYPSLKPLGAWVVDLKKRLKMFADWLLHGAPAVFCISSFYFTQSFLTGSLQNFARSYKIPIDEISFEFEVLPNIPIPGLSSESVTPPRDGCYVYGLFLEGARWDSQAGVLAEPFKRQLYSEMPVIWIKPVEHKKMSKQTTLYPCPVYKTSKRAGTLSTTGHSTNFVLAINLKSSQPEKHWVKRGVALLTQLDS